jgi:hypothetical protein
MSQAAQNFTSYLDSKGVRYDYHEATSERNEYVKITFGGKNAESVSTTFFFDSNGTSINVKSFSIAKIPSNKLMDMYVSLNELNAQYRWVKFYVDSDNEVTVSGDVIVDPSNSGTECYEIMIRYISIIDDVYPNIMKVIWG